MQSIMGKHAFIYTVWNSI